MANPIVQQINNELSELQKELGRFKDTVDYLNSAKTAVEDAVIKVNHSEAHFDEKVKELKTTYNSIIGLNESVSSVMTKLDSINFPERLDNIEKNMGLTIVSLNETKKQTLEEVQKASATIVNIDFEKKFKELQVIVRETVATNEKLALTIENLHIAEKFLEFEKDVSNRINDSYKEIEKNLKKIAFDSTKAITDLNLPIRIDKLDANIAGILNAIQNLQGRLDLVERNFSDKLKELNEKQKSSLSDLRRDINNKIDLTISTISNLEQKILTVEKNLSEKTIITWFLIVTGFIAVLLICKR